MVNHFSIHDQLMMKEALKEAKRAFEKEEVPVGAVLVFDGKIIARAYNQMETNLDPTAHAEVLCIQKGAEIIRDWRLVGGILYTTLEPCAMCAGAMLLARLSKVIWATPDIRHGAHGSWVNLFENKHPTHQLEIEGGLYKQEAAALMRAFFKQQRNKHEKNDTHIGRAL